MIDQSLFNLLYGNAKITIINVYYSYNDELENLDIDN